MAIIVDLDVMLARRKMSVGDFAAAVVHFQRPRRAASDLGYLNA